MILTKYDLKFAVRLTEQFVAVGSELDGQQKMSIHICKVN